MYESDAISPLGQPVQTEFSFEVLPPLKGAGIDKLFADIESLSEFNPRYINITTSIPSKSQTVLTFST